MQIVHTDQAVGIRPLVRSRSTKVLEMKVNTSAAFPSSLVTSGQPQKLAMIVIRHDDCDIIWRAQTCRVVRRDLLVDRPRLYVLSACYTPGSEVALLTVHFLVT